MCAFSVVWEGVSRTPAQQWGGATLIPPGPRHPAAMLEDWLRPAFLSGRLPSTPYAQLRWLCQTPTGWTGDQGPTGLTPPDLSGLCVHELNDGPSFACSKTLRTHIKIFVGFIIIRKHVP